MGILSRKQFPDHESQLLWLMGTARGGLNSRSWKWEQYLILSEQRRKQVNKTGLMSFSFLLVPGAPAFHIPNRSNIVSESVFHSKYMYENYRYILFTYSISALCQVYERERAEFHDSRSFSTKKKHNNVRSLPAKSHMSKPNSHFFEVFSIHRRFQVFQAF